MALEPFFFNSVDHLMLGIGGGALLNENTVSIDGFIDCIQTEVVEKYWRVSGLADGYK